MKDYEEIIKQGVMSVNKMSLSDTCLLAIKFAVLGLAVSPFFAVLMILKWILGI